MREREREKSAAALKLNCFFFLIDFRIKKLKLVTCKKLQIIKVIIIILELRLGVKGV